MAEMEEIMRQIQRNQVAYTVVCVNEFAKRKALHPQKAFFYLDKATNTKFSFGIQGSHHPKEYAQRVLFIQIVKHVSAQLKQ